MRGPSLTERVNEIVYLKMAATAADVMTVTRLELNAV
jgi:hypothetical protein